MALDDLAEELTRWLCIPFKPGAKRTITFTSRLRVTDWAVPLIFDGHAARDRDALIPVDFVGHALWPTLRATRDRPGERPWWSCTMSAGVARAIAESMRDDDEHSFDDGVWTIGLDVLLDERAPAVRGKRRAA